MWRPNANVHLIERSGTADATGIYPDLPSCGHQSVETMSTACQFFYDCKNCGMRLKPLAGDCCVFCSYGSVPCPPVQSNDRCCAHKDTQARGPDLSPRPRPDARSRSRELVSCVWRPRNNRQPLTKPFSFPAKSRNEDPLSRDLDQTTRFGHVGTHHRLGLPSVLQGIPDWHALHRDSWLRRRPEPARWRLHDSRKAAG